jgi:hypothetical protein
MQIRPTLINIVYNVDYVETLKENGKRGNKKAMAYILYAYNLELGAYHPSRYYADLWCVSKTTVCKWLRDFDEIIDNVDNYLR